MTRAACYLAGFVAVAAAGACGVLLAPREIRSELGFGVLVALVLQGPLGWWVISELGSDRFMAVWGAGMLIRVVVLALVALVVVPALSWAPAPVLLAMVVMLLAMLAVEAVTAARYQSQG